MLFIFRFKQTHLIQVFFEHTLSLLVTPNYSLLTESYSSFTLIYFSYFTGNFSLSSIAHLYFSLISTHFSAKGTFYFHSSLLASYYSALILRCSLLTLHILVPTLFWLLLPHSSPLTNHSLQFTFLSLLSLLLLHTPY